MGTMPLEDAGLPETFSATMCSRRETMVGKDGRCACCTGSVGDKNPRQDTRLYKKSQGAIVTVTSSGAVVYFPFEII